MSLYPIRIAVLVCSISFRCAIALCCVSTLLAGTLCAQTVTYTDEVTPSSLDSLTFDRSSIADTASPYSTYEKITNGLHWLTRESVLQKGADLTLGSYDTLSAHAFDEYEDYLRQLGSLRTVDFDVRTKPGEMKGRRQLFAKSDVTVKTADAWSLYIDFYGEPDDDRTVWLLSEGNLFGYAKSLSAGGDLEYSDQAPWRGYAAYRDPDLIGTSLQLKTSLLHSQSASRFSLGIGRPFYSDRTPRAWGGTFQFADGDDRFYFHDRTPGADFFYAADTNRSTRYDASAWVSFSNHQNDVFRFSAAIDYNQLDLESGKPYPRAFDNSVSVFVGISSLRRKFVHLNDYEFSGERLVPIGGQGRISAGKISPINGGLDNIVYFGAEARQSVLWGDFYAFASIEAGTGLRNREAQFTLERATASGALPWGPGLLAARIQQSTAWRWPRYLLLPIGHTGGGVRGYDYLDAFGASRLLMNVEYRLFPVLNIGLWDVGLAGFYDIGGAWDIGQQFTSARFHSGAGLGLRLGTSGNINSGFLRVDVAWNFDEGKIGRIDLGINEAFDVFGKLEYRPPAPYIP